MINIIVKFFSVINDKLWILISLLIIYVGIYFTFKFRYIQFNIIKMVKELLNREKGKDGLNAFKTLMLSLAGRIGVGSIAGISLAICVGGPGTIFWIWVIAILSSPITYCETFLGIKYRERDGSNFVGGPSYYIKKGLNNYKLGGFYAILVIICYIFGFISIQANTIAKGIGTINDINPMVIGLILGIISFLIILGGIKKISSSTSKIVPIMSLLYIGLSIYIIVINIDFIPNILRSIWENAFNIKAFTSSFLPTMILGIQKGIFSSESGIGTGSIAASSGVSNSPSSSGFVQMLGIYITSFLICTSTSLIVLTSNYKILNISDLNGIEIAAHSFKYHLGNSGNVFLLVLITLFAFSTILSGYYYGETCLKFFNKSNKIPLFGLKCLTALVIFFGSFSSSTVMWIFIDFFVAILSLVNIYAIIKLRNVIKTND